MLILRVLPSMVATCTTHWPAGTIRFATTNANGTWATILGLLFNCADAMPASTTNVTRQPSGSHRNNCRGVGIDPGEKSDKVLHPLRTIYELLIRNLRIVVSNGLG